MNLGDRSDDDAGAPVDPELSSQLVDCPTGLAHRHDLFDLRRPPSVPDRLTYIERGEGEDLRTTCKEGREREPPAGGPTSGDLDRTARPIGGLIASCGVFSRASQLHRDTVRDRRRDRSHGADPGHRFAAGDPPSFS